MSQPSKSLLSVSDEQQKRLSQLQQYQIQPQQQHQVPEYDPSSYYAAYYGQQQQQNPNYASYYQTQYTDAYQPQQQSENASQAKPAHYHLSPRQGGQNEYGSSQQGGQIGDQVTIWTGLSGQVAQPTNAGGGSTRGGRPSRGRGGGTFRGRGRGRGRSSFSYMSPKGPSSSSNPNPNPPTGEISLPTAEQKPKTTAPSAPSGQTFHCEVCKIYTTALELLEQHKNGKKHKKNLEKSGNSQPVAEKTVEETPNPETVGSETAPSGQKRGVKRKMRGGGRNGKSTRRLNEPPKIPLICELCFVKCDTQEVYERHVAGKKHLSKLKRYEGHHNLYGPMGLQTLYPPTITQTLVNAQEPQQAYPQSGLQQSAGYTVPALPFEDVRGV